jgi:hypothetical protein
MTYEEKLSEALADLDTQDVPNYSKAARDYGLDRTTIMRRHKGKTRSRAQFLSESSQNLTNEQEEVLIKYINRMTDRGMPPIAQIVKNLAEELIGKEVGKNWTSDFVKRYKTRLKSLYLSNIDNLRIKAEFGPYFQHFYDLV